MSCRSEVIKSTVPMVFLLKHPVSIGDHICRMCNSNVEYEGHFLYKCNIDLYCSWMYKRLNLAFRYIFDMFSITLFYLMSNHQKSVIKFLKVAGTVTN